MTELTLQEQLTLVETKIADYAKAGNDIMKVHYQNKRAALKRDIERANNNRNLLATWTIAGKVIDMYGYGNGVDKYTIDIDGEHYKTGCTPEWCYMQTLSYLQSSL